MFLGSHIPVHIPPKRGHKKKNSEEPHTNKTYQGYMAITVTKQQMSTLGNLQMNFPDTLAEGIQ